MPVYEYLKTTTHRQHLTYLYWLEDYLPTAIGPTEFHIIRFAELFWKVAHNENKAVQLMSFDEFLDAFQNIRPLAGDTDNDSDQLTPQEWWEREEAKHGGK